MGWSTGTFPPVAPPHAARAARKPRMRKRWSMGTFIISHPMEQMAAPRPVRLYESSIPSGNAYKVALLLAQLGHPVEVVALDILADPPETRRPAFLAKNPNGRIPLLELDDGSFLAESNAILVYLA